MIIARLIDLLELKIYDRRFGGPVEYFKEIHRGWLWIWFLGCKIVFSPGNSGKMGVHDLCDSDIGGLEGAKESLVSVVSIATSTSVKSS